MGSEYKVYVGAYLKVDVPEKESIANFNACGNDDCVRKDIIQGGIYCNTCGKEIETRQKIVKDHPYYTEFLPEEFEDSFFGWQEWQQGSENSQWILMPNKLKDLSKIGFTLSESEDIEVELPNQDVAETQFRETYIKEIGSLLANGCSVELKYGIVQFWY